MLRDKRKVINFGTSKAITIPANTVTGEEVTMAVDRIMIVDLKGEISEDELAEFLESYVQPELYEWLKKKAVLER